LLCVSTQEFPQFSAAPAQSVTHAELAQTWPSGQGLPQRPQCWPSELVSTQAPSHGAKPALQTARHSPSTHTVRPLAVGSQGALQAPQCATSESRSTQRPSQSSNGSEQAMPQVSLQTAWPLGGIGQAFGQVPQWSGS
jgi:hypothetical protein